jgi:hypothetical protein
MLKATRSFHDAEYGQVTAGRTRVVPDHDLARRYPDAFVPVESPYDGMRYRVMREGRMHGATDEYLAGAEHAVPSAGVTTNGKRSAPHQEPMPPWHLPARLRGMGSAPQQAPLPPWHLARVREEAPVVELRLDETSSVRVALADSARRTINEAARASRDGKETGGPLFGPPSLWEPSLSVAVARGPGQGVRHVGAFDIDHLQTLLLEQDFERAGSDLREIGFWHTHPGRGDVPSDHDLGAFASVFEFLDRKRFTRRFVALIANEDRDGWGWARPRLTAWVLERRQDGRPPVCRRAELK